EDEVGALALPLLEDGHLAEGALPGVGPHRARVEEDHVRLVVALDHGVALGRQHPEDLLGVPLVHLAAVGLEIDAPAHWPPNCSRAPGRRHRATPLRGLDARGRAFDAVLSRIGGPFVRDERRGLMRVRTQGEAMGDVIYIGLAVAFFGLSWAFVVLCE